MAGQTVTCSSKLIQRLALDTGPTMTAEDFLRRLHPEDCFRVELRALDSVMIGEPFAEDFRLLCPDGTPRRLHAAGPAGRDPDGHVNDLHGIALEMTNSHSPDREAAGHEDGGTQRE